MKEAWPDGYDPYAILRDPHAPVIHKLYADINIGIRERGERWSKCPNCGDPYQLTEEWSDPMMCSEECHNEYADYLSDLL